MKALETELETTTRPKDVGNRGALILTCPARDENMSRDKGNGQVNSQLETELGRPAKNLGSFQTVQCCYGVPGKQVGTEVKRSHSN